MNLSGCPCEVSDGTGTLRDVVGMLQPQHGGAHFATRCGGQNAALLPKPHQCHADPAVASYDITRGSDVLSLGAVKLADGS